MTKYFMWRGIFLELVLVMTNCFSQSKEIIHLRMGKVPGEDSMKHPARFYEVATLQQRPGQCLQKNG